MFLTHRVATTARTCLSTTRPSGARSGEHTHSVDPRDETWEDYDPACRVYFWDTDAASDEWELTGCDVEDALQWAHRSAKGRTFTLYSVVKHPGEMGLIRLLGTDPSRA